MRSGKSTALRGWTSRITETLRALITLKGPQWSQGFQWSQWFSGLDKSADVLYNRVTKQV